MFKTDIPQAVAELKRLALSPYTDDGAKVRALQIMMDRALGRAPAQIESPPDTPWKTAAIDAIVVTQATPVPVAEVDSTQADTA